MHEQPKVAVVISCYNYAHYVGAAIESALRQTVPYGQIIVVDDGSTDHSWDVISGFGDRITCVRQDNAGGWGLGASLAGLRLVRCPYVHFLDADDLADEVLIATVSPYLSDEPVKVQFPMRVIDGEAKPNGAVFPSFRDGYTSAQMIEDNRCTGVYNTPPTSGNIFSVSALTRLGLESALGCRMASVDNVGNFAMPHLGKVVTLDVPLASYRVHGNSVSGWNSPSPERMAAEISAFEEWWAFTCRSLGWAAPPFGSTAPAYVLERRLLGDALEGRLNVAPLWLAFARRMAGAHLPVSQKAVLIGWYALLMIPFNRLRKKVVLLRRSSGDRSPALQKSVALLRRAGSLVRG